MESLWRKDHILNYLLLETVDPTIHWSSYNMATLISYEYNMQNLGELYGVKNVTRQVSKIDLNSWNLYLSEFEMQQTNVHLCV